MGTRPAPLLVCCLEFALGDDEFCLGLDVGGAAGGARDNRRVEAVDNLVTLG